MVIAAGTSGTGHSSRSARRSAGPLACVLVAALVATAAHAQTRTWDGGAADGNWTSAANWALDTAPVAGEALRFQGTVRTTSTNTFAANTVFDSITLAAGGFTLDGNALQLSSSGTDIANTSSTQNNVNVDLRASSGGLTFASTSSGLLALSGVISGGGGITKTGAGPVGLGGNNTYTGNTTATVGILGISTANALGSPVDGTVVAAGAQLRVQPAAGITVAEPLTLSGSGQVGTGGGALRLATGLATWQGPITLAADASIGAAAEPVLTLDVPAGNAITANNFSLLFDGAGNVTVVDSIALGSGSLTKQGSGLTTLGGNLSFSGTSVVNAGGLLINGTTSSTGLTTVNAPNNGRIGGDGALAGSLSLATSAKFIFNPSATLDVAGAVTLPNTFGVGSLVNADASAIDWTGVADGTYTLIGMTTSTFGNITNFGFANAFDLGGGRKAFFQNGGLQLVVGPGIAIPEIDPGSTGAVVALLAGILGLGERRRPRR